MPPKKKIEYARKEIFKWFENHPVKVFKLSEFKSLFSDNRWDWDLAQNMGFEDFSEYLVKKSPLRRLNMVFPSQTHVLYVWGSTVSVYQVAMHLGSGAYLSHFTAMYIHELTDQISKTIYVTIPQPRKKTGKSVLTQEQIDRAFSKPSRVTQTIAKVDEFRIARLTGMESDGLGINEVVAPDGAKVFATTIERTLLDIVVRPVYAGGPDQVLEAFRQARGHISTNKLVAYYKKMSYVYPYHQAIGFYMERAGGYSENALNMLREIEQKQNFYLMHGMEKMEFVPEWRLYIPKGF